MKIAYIPTKRESKGIGRVDYSILPKNMLLVANAQHVSLLSPVKEQIEEQGIRVILPQLRSKTKGQILGCDMVPERYRKNDAVLYIGDGLFHPSAVSLFSGMKVFIFDPKTGKITLLEPKKYEKYLKKQKGAFLKFLTSDDIGILVSTKPGQENLKKVDIIKKQYPEKNYYVLAANDLVPENMENFSFIGCLINTACPRMSYDDAGRFFRPVLDMNYLEMQMPRNECRMDAGKEKIFK